MRRTALVAEEGAGRDTFRASVRREVKMMMIGSGSEEIMKELAARRLGL